MERKTNSVLAQEIMLDFARLTGLSPVSDRPRRYLWTDSFAVCNYLELFRRTSDEAYLDLALRLVDQVHYILGRHRSDDPRRGWISGLDDRVGALHPTGGGLRIGKQLNERRPGEPYNERLEWDRDGQYYHYLTKWMHALNRVSKAAPDPSYLRWAIELAKAAHAGFTFSTQPGGMRRMHWKMSIDLTRALVPSMGQHDPLDGLVTYSELQAAAQENFNGSVLPDLDAEIADIAEICRQTGGNLATDDPLGIGGLLFDASRVSQLMIKGSSRYERLLETIVNSALAGMEAFSASDLMAYPAQHRLAFRELGLSIGLQGFQKLQKGIEENPSLFRREGLIRQAKALTGYMPLGETIEQFWLEGINRETAVWTEHREINMVMLATSLMPGEFLMV